MVKGKFLGILFLALACVTAKAQISDFELDSLIDEVLAEDEDLYDLFDGNTNYHFIYYDATYANKIYIDGRNLSEVNSFYGYDQFGIEGFSSDQYYVSNSIYYFISNGIYFAANGTYYSGLDPHYRMTALSGGYSHQYKGVRLKASYDRYFYHISNYTPSFTNGLNAGISYRYKKSAGARIDYSHMFGNESDNLLYSSLYGRIKLFDLGGYDKIRLEPQLLLTLGNDTYDIDITDYDTDPREIIHLYKTVTDFGILNAQFELPLTISYKDFLLEIAYIYNIPLTLDPVYTFKHTNAFKVSIGYILSLN